MFCGEGEYRGERIKTNSKRVGERHPVCRHLSPRISEGRLPGHIWACSGHRFEWRKPPMRSIQPDRRTPPAKTSHPQRRRKEDGSAGAPACPRPCSSRCGPAAAAPRGLTRAELGGRSPRPCCVRPELSHRCPATILGWPQTRTRIAFGQSVAKPLS